MGSIPHLSVLKGPSRSLKANCIHRLFEDCCADSPEKTALLYEDGQNVIKQTYKELDIKTNRIGRLIVKTINEQDLQRNSDGDIIVAVCMSPSDKLVSVLLGIWKAGAAYLPLDPTFPEARIRHIFTEARPVMVIYDEDKDSFDGVHKINVNDLEKLSANIDFRRLADNECVRHQKDDLAIVLYTSGSTGVPKGKHNLLKYLEKLSANIDSRLLADNECARYQKDDLAIVLYTSGSTGVPKGVRLPHKIILNRLKWQFRAFPYSKTETIGVFKTALTFVDSVSEIWGPLINGLSILVVPKSTTKDPEKLVDVLEKYQIERLVLVPSLLRSLLMYLQMQKMENALKHLRIWVCSGETLAVSLANEFFKYFPENEHLLCNFYGSTEIMGDVTYHIIKSGNQLEKAEKIPIGMPIDNTILYLLDKDFRPVKTGDVGELFVSGLNLAAGYVNGRDPEKFIENPLAIDPMFSRLFRTGDFAKVERGYLQYEGRIDSQVKIRGHRVDLSEVEKAVAAVEGVDKCVVLCYKPGEMNQALLAFVTTSALLSENQIEGVLKDKLTSYMVPQVILIESIPLLVNGKIDRQLLLKSYENTNNNDDSSYDPDIDYAGVPNDRMKAAKVLFETVASVLNRSARAAICMNANFYEIGGNSLNSIYTITYLKEKGYHVSIGDFISAMDLGEVLERMTTDSKDVELKVQPPLFRSQPLNHQHKQEALDMITTSFYQKADLERWLMPDILETDYSELIDAIWAPLVEKGLSFVSISEETGKIIGVALNFDAHDEPEVEIHSKLVIIFEFLEFIEGPVRDHKLPTGKGNVLHSFMMATHSSLSAQANVAVMKFMEDEVLKLAKGKKFAGILTTNTSPLTQQLGTSVYGYKTMDDYQVNQFVASDKSRPFGEAPDSQRAIVHWKQI